MSSGGTGHFRTRRPITSLPGLRQVKLSRAPTYGLDGVLVSGSGVRRLVRASQDALGP
ncbi:hypothetical protein ACFWWB_18535 [Streptomyces sp. NPDC058690]|uniref:hypothetical protein n=1 Tax=Streptomyces sp. NPDC058690 TaxID=3346600 RepID=UPI0036699F75